MSDDVFTPEFKQKLRDNMAEFDRQMAARDAWLAEHRADPPVPVESLVLERNEAASGGTYLKTEGMILSLPPIDASVDFWRYRVYLGHGQAIVGFGKHFTVGVGFFDEPISEGTDLPYRVCLSRLWRHVKDNKGFHDVPDEACLRAIEMVQEAAVADGGRPVETEAESREKSPYLWDPERNKECPGQRGEHRCVYAASDHVELAAMRGVTPDPHKCTCGEEWT